MAYCTGPDALQAQIEEPCASHDKQGNSGSDFVLVKDVRPPPRIERARERMLMCRLYLGLIRSIHDDYGAEFAAHNDCATFRTIGIYVFLRTVMCSPVRATTIAQALKLPRVTRAEALAGNGQARIRGARRQCLSCHQQGQRAGPERETAATNRHDHRDRKRAVKVGNFNLMMRNAAGATKPQALEDMQKLVSQP